MEKRKGKKVLLALDGGIDSAVAGSLLKVQGYDLIGIHVQIWDQDGERKSWPRISYNCAGISKEKKIKELCNELNIPLHIISASEKFKYRIIDEYLFARLDGRPFLVCNNCLTDIVLRSIIDEIDTFGASYVATGDYARITYNNFEDHYSVWRSKNELFDSSRKFQNLSQKELSHLIFPIGDLGAKEVAKLAEKFELTSHVFPRTGVRNQPCFLHKLNLEEFIASNVSSNIKLLLDGNILDLSSKILKKHDGVYKFSVGEKLPGKIGGKKNLYIIDINLMDNSVIVGPKERLQCSKVLVNNLNLISIPKLKMKNEFLATSVAGNFVKCMIEASQDKKIMLEFSEPQYGFWRGKEVALYDNNLLIGGGIVEKVLK